MRFWKACERESLTLRYTKERSAAAFQSHRYIPDRFLPDKAIDVMTRQELE